MKIQRFKWTNLHVGRYQRSLLNKYSIPLVNSTKLFSFLVFWKSRPLEVYPQNFKISTNIFCTPYCHYTKIINLLPFFLICKVFNYDLNYTPTIFFRFSISYDPIRSSQKSFWNFNRSEWVKSRISRRDIFLNEIIPDFILSCQRSVDIIEIWRRKNVHSIQKLS